MTTNEITQPLMDEQRDIALADVAHEQRGATEFIRRHKVGISLGALATTAFVVAAPDAAETLHALGDNAHWVAPALIGSELAWNTGAATMLVAAGKKVGNPLKIRGRFKEALASSVQTKTFKAGFGLNIAGEIGTAGVVVGASVAELPPTAWPLTLGALATAMVPSYAIWTGAYKARKFNNDSAERQ